VSFANPLGLLALLSLPVILILHFLRERRRRLVVSNLALWQFLGREMRSPRFKRLPLTALLLLDLLLAALVALALAEPSLPRPPFLQGRRQVVVLLDTSSSMGASLGSGTRLTAAQRAAADLIGGLAGDTGALVVAFGGQVTWVGDTRSLSRAALTTRLADLRPSGAGADLEAGLALAKAGLDPRLPAEFHIFTDGAFAAPDETALLGVEAPLTWHWLGDSGGNQAVVDLTVTPIGGSAVQVFARVANFAAEGVTRRLALTVGETTVGEAPLDLPAGATVAQVWTLPQAPAAVAVRLLGGDALQADDAAFSGVTAAGRVRVLLVTTDPQPVQRALQAAPGVAVELMSPEQYARQTAALRYDLTVFRGYLPPSWPTGRVLVIEPPRDAVLVSMGGGRAIPADAAVQAAPDPLLAGIDFGGVRWGRAWTLVPPPPGFETLLRAGDAPLLLRGEVSEAAHPLPTEVWVLLADLGRGNLTAHPAFPVLLANLALAGQGSGLPANIQAGERLALPAQGELTELNLRLPSGETEAYSRDWPDYWVGSGQPGLVEVEVVDAQGGRRAYYAGLNLGDPVESDLRARPWTAEVAKWSSAAPAADGAQPQAPERVALAPYLLAAAALLFLLEAWLAWRPR
jgi:hypothetical protein